MSLQRVRVVLVRPQQAGNIGAVARLLENYDAGPLYLVAPEVDHLSKEALDRSTHGRHRLETARVVPTVAEALEGVFLTVGTSRRAGPVHQSAPMTPADLPGLLRTRAGTLALLFGPEDKGLSRDDLLACDATVQIPTAPTYPTLNLSHAVAICLYAIWAGSAEKEGPSPAAAAPEHEPADGQLMHRLMDKLAQALNTVGYLHSDKPDHLLFPLRAILSRARLTVVETRILMGLAQQIEDFARYGRRHR